MEAVKLFLSIGMIVAVGFSVLQIVIRKDVSLYPFAGKIAFSYCLGMGAITFEMLVFHDTFQSFIHLVRGFLVESYHFDVSNSRFNLTIIGNIFKAYFFTLYGEFEEVFTPAAHHLYTDLRVDFSSEP